MCGRYSLAVSAQRIHQDISPDLDVPAELPPNYNVAPTQAGLVITDAEPHRVQYLRWGLIPAWSKDAKIGARLINARSEGVADKPAFRTAVRRRRCLVLADSFYEWKREGPTKIPYRILLPDERLLLLAGLWESWRQPTDGSILHTFSILTTAPNAEMRPLHDRMPALLTDAEAQGRWLSPELPLPEVLALLQPAPDGTLTAYPVSDRVNKVAHNGADLHQRVGGA